MKLVTATKLKLFNGDTLILYFIYVTVIIEGVREARVMVCTGNFLISCSVI
jgi:hypothetical protein